MAFKKGVSGNPNGRPKKAVSDDLRAAIEHVEKRKNKKLLVHFVERAYESDQVLVALYKKVIPDLKQLESKVSGDVSVTLRQALNAVEGTGLAAVKEK